MAVKSLEGGGGLGVLRFLGVVDKRVTALFGTLISNTTAIQFYKI